MNILDIGLAVGLAGALAIAGTQTLRLSYEKQGRAMERAAYDKERNKQLAEHDAALSDVINQTKARLKDAEVIVRETETQAIKNKVDADAALAVSGRLRNKLAAIASQASAVSADSTSSAECKAAANAGVLQAQLLGLVEDAGRTMAAALDASRAAGNACSAQYDSLGS